MRDLSQDAVELALIEGPTALPPKAQASGKVLWAARNRARARRKEGPPVSPVVPPERADRRDGTDPVRAAILNEARAAFTEAGTAWERVWDGLESGLSWTESMAQAGIRPRHSWDDRTAWDRLRARLGTLV